MKFRHLFFLAGLTVLMTFQLLASGTQAQTSAKPIATENLKDSLSMEKKKRVKVVSRDKTRIHHIKKVEPTTKKTIN